MKQIITQEQLKTLAQLGLSKTQSQLYLASLKHGVLSVLELAKLTKISRQQIYEDAEKLIDLGLYALTRKQRRKYIAAPPHKLRLIAKARLQQAEDALSKIASLIPELEGLAGSRKNNVLVKHFEGLDKIKQAYEAELEAAKNTEVLSLAGSVDHIFRYFSESYWDKWNKKFVNQNASSRMLAHYSETAKATSQNDTVYARETRYLHQFPLKVNIDIFGNAILIVSFEDELALWIESPILSHSYRIMFNTLWAQASNFK